MAFLAAYRLWEPEGSARSTTGQHQPDKEAVE